MYAVIEDSGRQFRVAPGETLNVDVREIPAGAETIEFDKVLFISGDEKSGAAPRVGAPLVSGAKVKAKLAAPAQAVRGPDAEQGPEKSKGTFNVKGPKLDIWHVRRRKNRSRKKTGHRQKYLRVTIQEITA
jgi:large subunit ribosomal protein L21